MLSALSIDIHSESAVLMNGRGTILFEKNAHEKMYPASITKIATALVALEHASDKLNVLIKADHDSIAWISAQEKKQAKYTQPAYWLEPGASHIGLKKGEELSLRDLLYGMMVVSGDDASNVIAKYIGGSIPQFMDKVNERLQKLGCKNTHFVNPHGLFHPDHYTTAYDMAVLTREALNNDLFRTIVKTVRYTRPATSFQDQAIWVQTNLILRPGKHFYPYAIGVKTGYIQAAQNTIVAAAVKGSRLLIAVLLKSKERKNMFSDAVNLFEAAFNEPLVEKVLFNKGTQTFEYTSSEAANTVKTYLEEDVTISFYPAEEPSISCKLVWNRCKFPLEKGEKVGELIVESSDGQKKHIELKASNAVGASMWNGVIHFFEGWSLAQILAAIAFVIVITAGLVIGRRK